MPDADVLMPMMLVYATRAKIYAYFDA